LRALLLPGILIAELAEAKSLRFLNRRFFWFLFPAVVVPAPFIAYHILRHPGVISHIYSRPALHIPTLKNRALHGE